MRYLPGNAQHVGARQEQQDSFAFSDPADKKFLAHGGLLALVSDGMGGLSNGHQASLAAVRAFLSEYERKTPEEKIPAAMNRSLQAAFEVVNGLNRSAAGQSGATLVAAVAHGEQLYWVSVGDSRLYLVRGGRVVQLNRDHNYREKLLDQVAADQLSLADAMSHPEREHLTSYLGMVGSPEVDGNVRPFLLEPDDQVVLCTDGIYRVTSEQDFVKAFARNPSEGCEALKAIVLSRASQQQDNLTVIAFRCAGENASAAPAIPNLRSKIAVGTAGLMFCANLFAANFAWHTLRARMEGLKTKPEIHQPDHQKDLGPGPSPPDTKGHGRKTTIDPDGNPPPTAAPKEVPPKPNEDLPKEGDPGNGGVPPVPSADPEDLNVDPPGKDSVEPKDSGETGNQSEPGNKLPKKRTKKKHIPQ